jgi:hypothetical protein
VIVSLMQSICDNLNKINLLFKKKNHYFIVGPVKSSSVL